MKKKIFLLLLLGAVTGAVMTACGGVTPKVLVAYYSQSGNTKAIAEQIHARFGGDIHEIILATPYPDSEGETIEVAGRQREEGVLPGLSAAGVDLADYDVVFLGTPIWFGTASLPMLSFVEAHSGEWAGKTVVPFYTCGGGDAGTYVADITPHLAGATILDAFGNNRAERQAGTAAAKVAAHLDELKFF